MSKRKDNQRGKKNSKSIASKNNRAELSIGWIGVFLSIISLVISIKAIILTKTQIDLEYNQSRPNLSMSAEVVQNDDIDEEMLRCQIKNDGGIIREAVITPHLFLTYAYAPYLGADFETAYSIEIMDAFAPYFGDGIYYSSSVDYNPDKNCWLLEAEKERLAESHDFLFSIGKSLHELEDKGIVLECFDFFIELSYVDIMGNQQEEWYNATSFSLTDLLDGEASSYESYQLRHIDEHSDISLSVYLSSIGVNLGEEMKLVQDEDAIDELAYMCYEGLYER